MPILGSHAEETREPASSRVAGLPALAAKFTPVGKVRDLYRNLQESGDGVTIENFLSSLRIRLRVDAADEARIPVTGPTIVVANHAYGVLDGAILTVLLMRARPDVKVLTNFLPADIPEFAAHCIFVDPFQSDRFIESNRRALSEALSWLHSGGALALFPAGEVSHFQIPMPPIAHSQWDDTAIRLLRRTGASALPVYFCGRTAVGFQLLGLIHSRLRPAFLLQQLLDQGGKTVEVRIGSEIRNDSLAEIQSDRDAIEYLRWRTYLLARRKKTETSWPVALRSRLVFRAQEEIAPPIAPELLEEEVSALPPDRSLVENEVLAVYLGSARETPKLLQEIGRLREVTFRKVGEGTGKRLDLDRFDRPGRSGPLHGTRTSQPLPRTPQCRALTAASLRFLTRRGDFGSGLLRASAAEFPKKPIRNIARHEIYLSIPRHLPY